MLYLIDDIQLFGDVAKCKINLKISNLIYDLLFNFKIFNLLSECNF